MTDIKRTAQEPFITVTATLRLSEVELRALSAIASYDHRTVRDVLIENLGSSYLKPFESGLLSLLQMVKQEVDPILRRTDAARQAFVVKP